MELFIEIVFVEGCVFVFGKGVGFDVGLGRRVGGGGGGDFFDRF